MACYPDESRSSRLDLCRQESSDGGDAAAGVYQAVAIVLHCRTHVPSYGWRLNNYGNSTCNVLLDGSRKARAFVSAPCSLPRDSQTHPPTS